MRTLQQGSRRLLAAIFALSGITLLGGAAAPAWAHQEAAVKESEKREVMRAYFRDIKAARAIAHSKYETLESKYELGYMVVMVNPAEAKELRAAGFRLERDRLWQAQQLQMAREHNAKLPRQQMLAGIPNYSCYPTVEEVFSTADGLIAAKPQLASWVTIGKSWERTQNNAAGYDLKVLKLTNTQKTGSKPILFIQAGIHAREYTTTPLALEFAKKLVNGYGSDAEMTWILDHHEVHILLVTNPDGRKKAEGGILWRKNTNTNYCGATSNSRGADLNRNFTFGWNSTNGAGSSGSVCNDTYRGPTAGSEPEVKAIEAYIRQIWPDRRGPNRTDPAPADTSGIHLDIHSHGRLLLYPWGTNGPVAGNDGQLATLARKFSYWNKHTPQRSLDLYETDGTSDGPSYGELGVAAFTFELGTAFFEQCSYYNGTILPGNMPALVYAAKASRNPYTVAAGPEAHTVTASGSGANVTLSATLDDTRFNQSNGTEPTQTVAAAEYFVDTPPWVAGAVAKPMTAADGAFNSGVEQVRATLDTTGWSDGKHLVYVRGRDSAGNWGAVTATFVNVGAAQGTPPTAAFDSAASGLTVNFTNRSTDDGTITGYNWNFGDGKTSTSANPSNAYASGGTYTVQLTVTDNDGLSSSVSKNISVTDDTPTLSNGQTVSSISVGSKAWKYYKVVLPAGAKNFTVATSGGTGDIDLYTQLNAKPTTSSYSCRKNGSTNTETCSNAAPAAGTWYIGLYGYAASSGASLKVSWQ
ncbi:M14 family zinc carboxypeptidase [Massilia sp. W12]|uniref:M14 family zinc carboxypeptidase n=1 Tax=Massilia sp. W12 TaxID=3126507 RepID=UPI0030CE3C4E